MPIQTLPRFLFFDVFGTVVEWRPRVTSALQEAAEQVLNDPRRHLAAELRARVSSMTAQDWQGVAEDWRRSYGQFTRNYDPSQAFVSVDQHHYAALHSLLQDRQIEALFTDEERWQLALAWHRLEPWPDSVRGLALLNRQFRTCTLSNGNVALLDDLKRHGSLPFTDVASAENFGAYKPSPLVYRGAAQRFGLDPAECAMVAAHLNDLKGAKACGFQTIYVERPQEEVVDPDQARREGYVDLWISLESDGLVEAARQLGIPTD
ncbi:haloacid dehalogenase, type II [Aspergillus steynii IBT 23096]|uniref:Haloacid dehalogenase, type II n=1 Tax=Aspergillus steynii IBT 23096 TaxID=1392250 RepID=A0A2I2G2F7_9EURO|nr:haloacid dehalogenase, type II [Aspergillus steynii IBT 23096]PLB47037.1 haloacid dehalogenase, type II [Aspergillus steynii IBT 23096]